MHEQTHSTRLLWTAPSVMLCPVQDYNATVKTLELKNPRYDYILNWLSLVLGYSRRWVYWQALEYKFSCWSNCHCRVERPVSNILIAFWEDHNWGRHPKWVKTQARELIFILSLWTAINLFSPTHALWLAANIIPLPHLTSPLPPPHPSSLTLWLTPLPSFYSPNPFLASHRSLFH